MIDTSIAIPLRDGDPEITARIVASGEALSMSVVVLIELEAGVAMDRSSQGVRRRLLDEMPVDIAVLPFAADEAAAYGRIVASLASTGARCWTG